MEHHVGIDVSLELSSLCVLDAAGLQDVAVMREAVEQGRGHLCVAEHGGPLGEVEIGGDHHARVLVELGEQMEEQRAAGRGEWQVAPVHRG